MENMQSLFSMEQTGYENPFRKEDINENDPFSQNLSDLPKNIEIETYQEMFSLNQSNENFNEIVIKPVDEFERIGTKIEQKFLAQSFSFNDPVYTTNISNMNDSFLNDDMSCFQTFRKESQINSDLTYGSYSSCQNNQTEPHRTIREREEKTKRGRGGRLNRGTYKPRGRSKATTNSSSSYSSNSYNYPSNTTIQTQKVCINPEVLRRLGYQVSDCTRF